jgi:cephalosporin-C deacetylase-like acetyl esterase
LRIFTTFSIIGSAAIFCLDAWILRPHGVACNIHDALQHHHTENTGEQPMPFIARAVRAACALAALVAAASAMAADNGKPASKWKFWIEPALEKGGFAIDARTSEPETVFVSIRDIATSPPRKLAETRHERSARFRIESPEPGNKARFVEVKVTTGAADAEPLFQWRTMVPRKGEKLMDYEGLPDLAPPPDFDAYWKRARAELAAVPMQPIVEPVPEKDTTTGLLFRVDLPAVEATTISCWYYVPRAAFDKDGRVVKRFPAVQIAPGYGAEEPPIDRTKDGFISLSVNPRNHGPSRDFWKSPVEHLAFNIGTPEKYYYRLAVMDVVRAAEFLFSRPEVDTGRVAAEGGSQGGYFAIAAAAFEPRFRCVASNVTAFSAYPEGMKLNLIGFATTFRKLLEDAPTPAERAAIAKSLAYTDGANLARLVKCPVQVNMGDRDPVCNFVCGIVVHNRLPKGTVREINVFPDCRHEVPEPMREATRRWYREHLLK